MRPSVELVTLPENSAENFCSNVSGPDAADGVVDRARAPAGSGATDGSDVDGRPTAPPKV